LCFLLPQVIKTYHKQNYLLILKKNSVNITKYNVPVKS
jgi:hypothetical protein